jgi:hypothetical protein
MPETTEVLTVRLSKADYDQLHQEAQKNGLDISVFVRDQLAKATPSLRNNVAQHGGARKGAGRPRKHVAEPRREPSA